jgi:CobQ-like glutamine amidotransferase family enzyme
MNQSRILAKFDEFFNNIVVKFLDSGAHAPKTGNFMELKLAYFYPTLMNLYGDRGNVQTFAVRCRKRGIKLTVTEIGLGDSPNLVDYDLAFFGGGQDKEQFKIGADLIRTKAGNLRAAIDDGLTMLAVCGGLQLLGDYYRPLHGSPLQGISVLDLRTEGGNWRAIGNVIAQVELVPGKVIPMVGFENHSGRTFLGPDCRALAEVTYGFGNNGQDGREGARRFNCFGTYLHGPLLPKNPDFADHLIALALRRKYGKADLQPLDDTLEIQTRDYVIKRVQRDYLFRKMLLRG